MAARNAHARQHQGGRNHGETYGRAARRRRIYETLNDGRELAWGEVEIYEPGVRFAMAWRLGRPVEQGTLVSVHFEPLSDASCRVTLTHENWERLAEEGAKMRDGYNMGWVEVFERRFADYAGLVSPPST
ncbi:MAG: SRPBCC domain-containing protein [Hyphomonadaceae bacterium]|nr:SRPBCC domain-containing protein [Hyphomonadaceae bacterium]